MKAKLSIISIFVLALALLSVWAVGAQGPQSPQPAPQREPRGLPMRLEPEGKPFSGVPAASARSVRETEEVGNAAIPLGQPGLSFRYVQTFGVTEEPYPVDTSHLNGAAGLLMDASNQLYVAEGNGHRVLRFNALGANDLVLGHAGLPWHHDDYLSWPRDVAVDASGNIWVVFSPAVKKFAPSGNPLLTIPGTDPWQSGNDNYHFDDPRGIAFDSLGRLFVSDTGNHRIQVYDVSGSNPVYVLTIGVTGQPRSDNTGFNGPHHIAFDGSGRLYVVDAGNYRVQRCTRNPGPPETWTCTTFFGVTGQEGSDLSHLSWGARGIAVRGNDVFITDSANYRVLKCNLSGSCSHFAGTTGERGWDNAHFWWPEDVAVDSSGNVYVSDWDNHRVQVFNSGGTYSRTIGVTRVPYVTDNVHLNNPWGIAAAPDGSIYITERWGYRLVKLNAAGVQQWAVGQAGVYGSDNNHFGDWWAGPEGKPAVDAAGRIYVPDMGNHRIQVFNPDGTYFTTFGSYGDGKDQFDCPGGVAISPVNGDILVADSNNHRVQIYTSAFVYKATLGVLDETGTDNHHFNWPKDVAVDASGSIYVADTENRRVQKCTLSSTGYTCSTFVGETGVFNDDFGHLHPLAVVVDSAGRVYVVDEWNSRIQVFDSAGAYLTTIGGAWGSNTGQLRGPSGVAVDSAGNVYVADRDNHRIQKFAPGVPGWKQVNINGFGDRYNLYILSLAAFGNHLYAGTYSDNGAQLWRMDDSGVWTSVMTDGFGNSANVGIDHLLDFNSQLYAGTWANEANGGEVWRSGNGLNWTRVVSQGFGDPTNGEVFRLAVFNGQIYASTWSYTTTHGAEIWRSITGNSGSWTRVVANGFGNPNNQGILTMEEFNSALYVGTYSWGETPDGADIWRSTDGVTWMPVITNGFNYTGTHSISSLEDFGGYLYAAIGRYDPATQSYPGGQIWRCAQTSGCDGPEDWSVVTADGFGKPDNYNIKLFVFDNRLYAVTSNSQTGIEVWRTADGTNWEQVGFAGLGDSNNYGLYWDNAMAVHNNRLYIGITNRANGGEVWKKTITADFSASPRVGPPGMVVTFTNLSGGDVVTANWHFGDGSAPLLSNATTVTHTYSTPGVYTVTLTVQDGVDTDVRTRPAHIRIAHFVYLPLVLRNYNPLMMLYDDFNNPTFDGAYDPIKWRFWGDSHYFSARQINGTMVITNTVSTPAEASLGLPLAVPLERTLRQVQRFQAKMMMGNGTSGTGATIQIAREVNGSGWWAQCGLNAYDGNPPYFGCDITNYTSGNYQQEYGVLWPSPLNFNTWYTARIDIDPNTAQVCFYLNGNQLGCHVPNQADTLKMATDLIPRIGSWNGRAGATGVRYFDDVYITPAWP